MEGERLATPLIYMVNTMGGGHMTDVRLENVEGAKIVRILSK